MAKLICFLRRRHVPKAQSMKRNGTWHDHPEIPLAEAWAWPSTRVICSRCGKILVEQ